jgi:triosephosphate isomerase (TIM)
VLLILARLTINIRQDVSVLTKRKNNTRIKSIHDIVGSNFYKQQYFYYVMFINKKPYITRKLDFSKPFIVLNLKTYSEATNENAIKLALIAERVQEKTGLNIIVCVQATDLKEVASRVKIPIFAQHTDYGTVGKNTGKINPEHLLNINIKGSLLNHSENRIDIKDIEKTVIRLKELAMTSIVCAKDSAEAKKIANFKTIRPTFIAIEPPELIGGEISVSSAKPEIIPQTVKTCGGIPVLIGAGIKHNEDVKIAIQNGAKGVLLASHFILSKDPEKFLMELLKDVK